MEAKGVSANLGSLIGALLSHNLVRIGVGTEKTGEIHVRRGVPQGGPLSHTLFNLAIDYLYKEVCDPLLANTLGYQLNEGEDGVILTGFADDQAVTSCSVDALERTVDMVQRLLREIGLQINPSKSAAIIVADGSLFKDKVLLEGGEEIDSIGVNEAISYLGCSFSGGCV